MALWSWDQAYGTLVSSLRLEKTQPELAVTMAPLESQLTPGPKRRE